MQFFNRGLLTMVQLLQHKRCFHTLYKFSVSNQFFYAHYDSRLSKSHHFRRIYSRLGNGLVDFFDGLLQLCIGGVNESINLERPIKQVHAQIMLTSSSFSAFLSARLISVYSKLSQLNGARKVFDTSPEDCFFSSLFWNSMLRAYASSFRYEDVLELYGRMRELNVQPDGFGFPLIIKACGVRGGVRFCRSVHCHALQMGFAHNQHVSNELLGMYGEIGWMELASQVFDQMPLRNRISWNVMISGFAKNYDCDGAYGMLCRMESEGWEPNAVTWTSLISSFARCGLVDKTWEFYIVMRKKGVNSTAESVAVVISVCDEMPIKGEIIHGHVIAGGFQNYVFLRNALISMYGRNGATEKAEYLFSGLETKSIVSWNALISAYAQSGSCDEAYSAFLRLENLNNTVRPNVVTWTAVINGFAANGRHSETLELFRHMQFAQVAANAVTLATLLSGCAELSHLPHGKEIHARAIRTLMDSNNFLITNALTNMYMKCGTLKTGHLLFDKMARRDITSWNIMITGYGMHGFGSQALKIFNEMVSAGFQPDKVTFVAVLSACSHSGLVSEGHRLFDKMLGEFRIEPEVEHYSCMVDLFGRAGLLQEAKEILKNMPMEPNVPVWGALLNSCKMHKNTDFAKETAERIFDLGYEVTGSYMLLSNLYAENERWDDSAKVRFLAKARGLRKVAGMSWIEVKKKVCLFSAGKGVNLEMEEVYHVLRDLNVHMMEEKEFAYWNLL